MLTEILQRNIKFLIDNKSLFNSHFSKTCEEGLILDETLIKDMIIKKKSMIKN